MGAGLERGYERFLELCGTGAGAAIAALALLVSADVVMRNLGLGNFPWLLDLAEYVLYASTFLAAPWVLHRGAHVRVDLLLNALPRRAAVVMETAIDAVGLAVSLVFVYYGAAVTLDSHRLDALVVKELVVPEWRLLVLIPLCASLLAIEFARRLVRARHGERPPAPSATATAP